MELLEREPFLQEFDGLLREGSSEMSNAGGAMRDTARRAKRRMSDGYSGAEDAVRENPLLATAIAFGAGMLIGMCFMPSMRTR